MRKTLAIALLAFSIAMIAANSLAKRVHRFLRPQATETKTESDFFPFEMLSNEGENYIKVHDLDEDPSLQGDYTFEENYKPVREYIPPVLKVGLTEEEKRTVESYAKNDKLKAFMKELSGVITQDDLKQGNYLQVVYNPKVRSIFEKYAQDEEFREIATNVMKDKEVLEFARKIIQNDEVKK